MLLRPENVIIEMLKRMYTMRIVIKVTGRQGALQILQHNFCICVVLLSKSQQSLVFVIVLRNSF